MEESGELIDESVEYEEYEEGSSFFRNLVLVVFALAIGLGSFFIFESVTKIDKLSKDLAALSQQFALSQDPQALPDKPETIVFTAKSSTLTDPILVSNYAYGSNLKCVAFSVSHHVHTDALFDQNYADEIECRTYDPTNPTQVTIQTLYSYAAYASCKRDGTLLVSVFSRSSASFIVVSNLPTGALQCSPTKQDFS